MIAKHAGLHHWFVIVVSHHRLLIIADILFVYHGVKERSSHSHLVSASLWVVLTSLILLHALVWRIRVGRLSLFICFYDLVYEILIVSFVTVGVWLWWIGWYFIVGRC